MKNFVVPFGLYGEANPTIQSTSGVNAGVMLRVMAMGVVLPITMALRVGSD